MGVLGIRENSLKINGELSLDIYIFL